MPNHRYHGDKRGLITKNCLYNEHLHCASDQCPCICHRDEVLIEQLRQQLRRLLALNSSLEETKVKSIGIAFVASVLALCLGAGCKAQVPAVPQLSCPPATTVGTYTNVNPSGIITATTYSDSGMASGASFCYIVQSVPDGKIADGTSGPSNIAGPFTSPNTAVTHVTALSWGAPAGNKAGVSTYIVSRVAAISTIPTAPLVDGNPSIAEARPQPADNALQLSLAEAPKQLRARLAR